MSNLHALNQHLTLFKLNGGDVATFLHNQLINEFQNNAHQPHYSAICNAKGRIIFSLLLWQKEDDFYIAVDPSLAEQFSQYLHMRVFRMAVKISQSEDWVPVVSEGSDCRVEDITLAAKDHHKPAHDTLFWSLFFNAQLPWITHDSSEQFIPQHLSLDQHQLIDYQKGCYPGQEIIARLHFIGRNKKQLSLIQIEPTNGDPKNGEKVTINDSPVQLCSPVVKINGQNKAQIVKNSALE